MNRDKIAILIFAHKNIDQLKRLVSILQNVNFDVFIHISKKFEINSEQISHVFGNKNHYFIVDRRFDTYLDDKSLIDSIDYTIKYAKSKYNYKYYIKLSGQDFPIKNLNLLNDFLLANYPHSFIDITPVHKNNWVIKKLYQPRWFSFILTRVRFHIKNSFVKRILLFIPFILSKLWSLVFNYERFFNHNRFFIYGGSPMWILSNTHINEITLFGQTTREKLIKKKLKIVWTPEEIYYQSILMNGKNKEFIKINPFDQIEQNSLIFNYFTDKNKPFKGHPYTLTKENYDFLIKIPQFFARRFDIQTDSIILDLLEKKVKNG
jgi:hypothetical protein